MQKSLVPFGYLIIFNSCFVVYSFFQRRKWWNRVKSFFATAIKELTEAVEVYRRSLPPFWGTQLKTAIKKAKEDFVSQLCDECIVVSRHVYDSVNFFAESTFNRNIFEEEERDLNACPYEFLSSLKELIEIIKSVHDDKPVIYFFYIS